MNKEKIKVLSLFSGIGAFEKALSNIGINYELINYCEIDKYASKAYSLIHNIPEDKNLWDVTKLNTFDIKEEIDLLTHGSPCQSFSISGQQEGGDIGSGTKSSLMWETVRIVKDLNPKVVVWENVKNILSKTHIHNFNAYLKALEEIGYNNYYQVLNSKDYGIPQNRERIFVISIKNNINKIFSFPEKINSKLRLIDLMEQNVNKKYYIKDELSIPFIKKHISDYYNYDSKNNIYNMGLLNFKGNESIRRVYHPYGIAPTLTTMTGGNRQPKVIVENNLRFIGGLENKKMWLYNDKFLSRNFRQGDRVYDCRNISTAITSNGGGIGRNTGLYMGYTEKLKSKSIFIKKLKIDKINQDKYKGKRYKISDKNFFIRRLTPKECLLLMGFTEKDYEAIKEFSDTQIYKMAGNSIVVNVLEEIFKNIFIKHIDK